MLRLPVSRQLVPSRVQVLQEFLKALASEADGRLL
jgi:hypothetical protein